MSTLGRSTQGVNLCHNVHVCGHDIVMYCGTVVRLAYAEKIEMSVKAREL